MRSRWIGAIFGLLFLVLLITTVQRLGPSLLDPHFFHLESKLIYIIVSSVGVGALLLFVLVTFFPPWLRNREQGRLAIQPAKPARKIAQIQTALQLGDARTAADVIATIEEGDPNYSHARKILADVHSEKGEWNDAAREYRIALKTADGPEKALLLLSLGSVFEQQDQSEQAKDLYLQALRICPEATEAVRRLRNVSVREQDWNEAMQWQEQVEERHSGTSESPQEENWKLGIRLELARLAAGADNFKTAQALLKYIFRMTDFFAPAYLLQGQLQEKQNVFAGLKVYEQGFDRTQNPAILKRIGETFLLHNQPQRAIDFFRDVVRKHPTDPRLTFSLGDLYRKLEMSLEALKVFESVRERHPDWLLNNVALAEIYVRHGEKEQALRLYKSVVDSSETASVLPWECYTCNTTYIDYREFCFVCLEWNSVNINQNKAGMTDFGYEKSTALPL